MSDDGQAKPDNFAPGNNADDAGIGFEQVVMRSADDIRRLSPVPYGVFVMALNGTLVSYHYLLKKEIAARVQALGVSPSSR